MAQITALQPYGVPGRTRTFSAKTAAVFTAIHILSTGAITPLHASDSGDNLLLAGVLEAQGAGWIAGLHVAITTKTDTDYTLTVNDDIVLFDTGATTRTATLPAASVVIGKIYHVKKIDAGIGFVTIDGNASETIDGDLTPDITAQYESFSIVSDGSNWYVI